MKLGNIYSDVFIQKDGVLQGSVLCIILFIIKINKILSHLITIISVHGLLYVDSLHILCTGKDLSYNERQLQQAVNS